MSMIKLIKDLIPFRAGEVLTFGIEHDAELVDKGFAVWTKVSDQNYLTK